MMPDPTQFAGILGRLLGGVDGACSPLRSWVGSGQAAALVARTAVLRGRGVPWRPAPTDEARRVEQKLLQRAERAGLLRRLRGERKTLRVALTPDGDNFARAMAGVPGADAGWWAVREVIESPIYSTFAGVRLVPEWALGDGTPHWRGLDDSLEGRRRRNELVLVEMLAAPALARGWLTWGSDVHGRVWYAGGPETLPAEPPRVHEAERSDEAVAEYAAAFEATRAAFAGAPRGLDIAPHPLPASLPVVGLGVLA